MKTLNNLFWMQQFAKLKNIFRKPLTAVLTIGGVLFFLATMILMLIGAEHIALNAMPDGQAYVSWLAVGMMGFMFLSQVLQASKKSLFFVEDSYYLFTMPLSQKQVIGYLILQDIMQSLYFGLFVLFMCSSFALSITPISWTVSLAIFVTTTISSLTLLMIQNYYYLLKIVQQDMAKKILLGLKIFGVLVIGGILWAFYSTGGNIQTFAPTLVNLQALQYIPIIGWMKGAIFAAFTGHSLTFVGYTGALLVMACVTGGVLVNFKGEFYEEAMQDSENYTAAYRAAKTGKTAAGKVHDVNEAFQENEMAFFSKEMLLLKKTRQFLKKDDIVVIVMYLFISYLSGMTYDGYARLMFIWLFISMMRSSIGTELKSPYIYLAPGKPLKKMFAITTPILITPSVMIVVSYILGGIVFKATPLSVVEQLVSSLSMIPLLLAGNVFALRILRGQSNMIVENVLRLVIMFVVLIPTLIATFAFFIMFGESSMMFTLITFALAVFNLLGAYVVFWLCAPMLNGGDVSDF